MPGPGGHGRRTEGEAAGFTGRSSSGRRTFLVLPVLVAFCLAISVASSFGSDFTMKGPREEVRAPEQTENLETSSVNVALLGMIRFYQQFISPVGGADRCGFRPSCSSYGYQAIRDQGAFVGVMMIGDRQTRCNIFDRPGYTRLPNGKLYDPASENLLTEK
jgi:putative membrane protein insertion efficiency factor